jgi:hypothetical protein
LVAAIPPLRGEYSRRANTRCFGRDDTCCYGRDDSVSF